MNMARRVDIPNALAAAAVDTSTSAASGPSATQSPHPSAPANASRAAGGAGSAVTTPIPYQAHPTHLPASVQAQQLLLQGKLLRRDRTFLTWKWRDVYLEQHRLQYFSEKGVRKGEIVITPTTPIMIRLLNEPKPHGFLVFIKDEKLTLAAATAQDRQKWIDVFTDFFHANIEDYQTTTKTTSGGGSVVDKQEKKRTRPTFLPIPDLTSEEEAACINQVVAASGSRTPTTTTTSKSAAGGQASGASSTAVASGMAAAATTTTRSSLLGRLSEGMLSTTAAVTAPGAAPPAAAAPTTAATAATPAATMASALPGAASSSEDAGRRSLLFRGNDAGTVTPNTTTMAASVELRSKFIALKEHYSSVTFPRTLANGDVLVGVGPLVRRMGWTDERILAVGLYVDADAAAKELHRFHCRTLKSLRGDQSFYDFIANQAKFRRSFVVTSRKRVSKSVLIALLHDEIAPRMVNGSTTDALHTFLSFIEKSLRKAESLMLRIYPESGRLEFRLRGQQYPPIASSMLCQCIQAVFFDVNSIQQDAKRRLIERFPLLWGIEDPEDVLLALGNSDKSVVYAAAAAAKRGSGSGSGGDATTAAPAPSDSDDEDDDDDEEEDEESGDGDDDGESDGRHPQGRRRASTTTATMATEGRDRGNSHPHALHTRVGRGLSMKEKLDELDEQEHEVMRRESRTLGVHFAPIVDKDSNVFFRGDLLVDGSVLLGTWSQPITYLPLPLPASPSSDSTASDDPQQQQQQTCVVSVGLYAEPGGASEALLKYKGLSVGSILQDPDFFARFADGLFAKHLIFKVQEDQQNVPITTLIEYFTARVRRRGSGAGVPGSGVVENGRSSDAKVRALVEKLDNEKVGELRPDDELHVAILADAKMTLSVTRKLEEAPEEEEEDASKTDMYPSVDGIKVAAAPFSIVFQGIFYGYHTIDPSSRVQLLERLPVLLDLAKDDLAHTYHDEIQVLKENYKRQLPEFRLKAGYLLISFEKKKMMKTNKKNGDGDSGTREPFVVASKWSKRWCRLDGATFSYFSHKRSKKPREILDLTLCTVSEIIPPMATAVAASGTSAAAGLALFAVDKSASRPSIRIGISKGNGEIMALKTESIYEGAEWLESLVEASNVVKKHQQQQQQQFGYQFGVDGGAQEATRDENVEQAEGAREEEDEIETSGGGDADESSGVLDDAEEEGDAVHGHVTHDGGSLYATSTSATTASGPPQTANAAATMAVSSSSSSSGASGVDTRAKHGSLLAWVLDDPRHTLIFGLLVLVTWLVTSQDPDQFIRVAASGGSIDSPL